MGPLEQPFNPSQVALTSVGEPNGSPAVKPKMSLGDGISLGNAIWQPIKDVINFFQTKKENERNRAFAEQQATTAYERQLELWRMEKQYESPAAQMQRYLQAGLNPNLIYGNVSAPGSPAAAPMGNAANQSAPQLQGDPFGAYLNSELVQAQVKRLEVQNDNDTRMTDAQVVRFAHLNNVSEADVRKAASEIELMQARTDEVRQGIENMKVEWESLSEDVKAKRFQNLFTEATLDMRIAGANAEQEAIAKTAVALAFAKLMNVKADTALKWSNIELNQSQMSVNQSIIRLNNAQSAVAYNQANLVSAMIQTQNATTDQIMQQIQATENYNRHIYGSDDDGWFLKGVHAFTSTADAVIKMVSPIFGSSINANATLGGAAATAVKGFLK